MMHNDTLARFNQLASYDNLALEVKLSINPNGKQVVGAMPALLSVVVTSEFQA